jgi:hypothetical protein
MNGGSQALPAVGIPAPAHAATRAAAVPWYCVAVVLGAACVPIGVLWDISWHLTIGRDTFWTPAHMLIYLGGALPGCVCGWLVLKTTFWPDPGNQVPAVRLWGFRAPLGAWVVVWGAFAMLTSGPFDNWWHNAYGLDVKIVSPPHTILALGTYAVAIGGLLLVLSWQNRAPEERFSGITVLVLISFGTLLTKVSVFTTEYTYPNQQHTALFYQVVCLTFPLWLVAAARAARIRWAATITAVIYTLVTLGMIWVLPLFPGHPKLGPIYNPLTHMVPPPFPLLLIVPALAIDLVMLGFGRRHSFWKDTLLAVVIAVLFFVLLLAVEWPFAKFLLSPASRNAFFAGNAMWGYGSGFGHWRFEFWDSEKNPLTVTGSAIACGFSFVQARMALWIGDWFSKVQR